jgi:hypothetical protein
MAQARAMLFARVVLLLAKISAIKCLLKANGGGRLSYGCISGQSILHVATPSARGSTAWWQKLSCAGQPVGTQTAIFGLSLVIPVPSRGPPLRLAAREEGRGARVRAALRAMPLAARGSQLPATGSSRPYGRWERRGMRPASSQQPPPSQQPAASSQGQQPAASSRSNTSPLGRAWTPRCLEPLQESFVIGVNATSHATRWSIDNNASLHPGRKGVSASWTTRTASESWFESPKGGRPDMETHTSCMILTTDWWTLSWK